ncbi:MAG: asparagine synthase C-terminal domain-containing protein, partial [Bacteriovoracales bacterium]|nr:asparagine synthase C-terminal domain-containing protein [Bacteriovoracales bacterium]
FSKRRSEKINLDHLGPLISNSVKRCTLSDTPLALFLSGGLDSSLVGYFLKKEVSDLKSLNMSLKEKSYDETPFAKRAASILKTRHLTFEFDDSNFDEKIISLYGRLDAPNGDSGLIPFWLLSQKMAQEFKVAVGGDGGDEIFFGYDTHLAFYVMDLLSKCSPLAAIGKTLLGGLSARWPRVSRKRLPLGLKFQRLARSLSYPRPYFAALLMASLDTDEINQLLGQHFRSEEIFSEALTLWEETDSPCDEDRFNSYYLHLYLPGKVLAKVDRASMLKGLEVRSPLLDKNLFEYCSPLSPRPFHEGWQGKPPLRKLAARFIDRKVARKPKRGFGFPVSNVVERPLIAERIRSLRDVDGDFLNVLAKKHAERKGDYGQALWNGFVLSFFDSPPFQT